MRACSSPLCNDIIIAALITAAMVGCSSPEPSPQPQRATTQRDSAGVTIVEITENPWAAQPWATVDTTNVVRIGATDSANAPFFGYLVTTSTLSDGTIIAIDGRPNAVKVFTRAGAPLPNIGRHGQGPGEFDKGASFVLVGINDTLHFISPNEAIDVFSAAGVFARRIVIDNDQPLLALPDGSYLSTGTDEHEFVERKTYDLSDSATIYKLAPNSDTTAILARYLSSRRTYHFDGRSHKRALQIFQPLRYAAGASFGFVWCEAATFICDLWNSDGKKLRSIRVISKLKEVTDADVANWRAPQAEALKTKPAALAQLDKDIAIADRAPTFPLFSQYRVDRNDNIWFREFSTVAAEIPRRWIVISPEGALLGTVVLPDFARLTHIGDRTITGLERGTHDDDILAAFRFTVLR